MEVDQLMMMKFELNPMKLDFLTEMMMKLKVQQVQQLVGMVVAKYCQNEMFSGMKKFESAFHQLAELTLTVYHYYHLHVI